VRSGVQRWTALLRLASVIAMIAAAQPAMSKAACAGGSRGTADCGPKQFI